jgi:hypothetical protein
MATQPEKAFCVLEFHSTKSVITVQREFRRKFKKDPPTANSIRKWYQKSVDTGCICKGKTSGRPSTSGETVDRVRHARQRSPRKSTSRASRELNVPQPTVWKILRKILALRPCRLKMLQHITPNDRVVHFEFFGNMMDRIAEDETFL